jgi:RimJ/RimL family protein N-acetyltransferase
MPLPVLLTRRMLLRPFAMEDVDALHALWNAPEVRRFLWDDVVISRDVACEIVASHFSTVERHAIGYWALHQKAREDASIAGFCGFRLMDGGPEIELMYGLRGQYWGKGWATEACFAALEYLWRSTAYQQVYARADPPNEKSIRVMLRLGMTYKETTSSLITYVLKRPV